MNLEEEEECRVAPQPVLRRSTCPRHPDETFTGFCPECLCERLSGLDKHLSTASTRPKPTSSTASAALKAIFRSSDYNKASTSAALPELRRCKSFSGGKGEGFAPVVEPKRRSCDVRGRSSLWNLFNQDDVTKLEKNVENCRDLGFAEPVLEEEEEEEIRVLDGKEEIVEAEEGKRIKDQIEIDLREFSEKKVGNRGSFWTAASLFSNKLQKWRSKQKRKKLCHGGEIGDGDGVSTTTMQVDKPYSEIGDYGFGRRSCDIDPRFSLDAARMSFDDPRYSWDEPRASWDGYLIGRMFPRALPQMVSVVEQVERSDGQIPVEEPEGGRTPGGTAQTRDYYSDMGRRKSLDRSNSSRKKAVGVGGEVDDGKLGSNAKVTPASTEIFRGSKVLVTDRNLRGSLSNSNSLRDDCSDRFESVFRDSASIGSGKGWKKSRRWIKAWNIWGLISKRGGNKDDDEERFSRGNVVQRSFSESWPELQRELHREAKGGINRVLRSNSSVSSRNSVNMGGSFGGLRRTDAETNNGHGRNKREECVLERNRSARYSPNNLDNGLLRFYLTPMRSSSRRNGAGKSRPRTSHSIASSILRMY